MQFVRPGGSEAGGGILAASAHIHLARRVGENDQFYHCETCEPAMRQTLGHDGPPGGLWRENLLTGEPLTECPLRTILRLQEMQPKLSREVDSALRQYGPYDRGVLLVAGGISDQPARWSELMDLVDHQKNETEAKYLDLLKANADDAPPAGARS